VDHSVPHNTAPLSSTPPALRKSETLHQRVLSFAQSFEQKAVLGRETFERLAVDIARFQMENSAGLRRLFPGDPAKLKTLAQLPVVPCDVFRLTRVALHPPELDEALFQTSGTTGELTGKHPVRRLATKTELSLLQAKRTLFRDFGRGVVVALAQAPSASSSLVHLMELLIRHFDGRPLLSDPTGAAFSMHEPGRFLISTQGVDVEGLKRAARLAKHRLEPFYVLSTSFSMVAALDALDGETISAPARTKIMLTGGFKGRKKSVNETELRENVARCFGVDVANVIGEYGMTELGSQLFEQRPPDLPEHKDARRTEAGPGEERWWDASAAPGTYFAPPWLKVQAVDPQTYQEVGPGEVGLAHFIDLCNVDSCISVLTQDMIQLVDGGVKLLGRAPQAPARGCSLPFEALALSGGRAQK